MVLLRSIAGGLCALALVSAPVLGQAVQPAPVGAADARLMADRDAYRAGLAAELARREALLQRQEAALAATQAKAKELHAAILAEATKARDAAAAGDGGAGGGVSMGDMTRNYERQTYASAVARSEVMATRKEIRDLREILARP